MQSEAWIALFRRIPPERHNTLAVITSVGIEISVSSIVFLEEDYAIIRGRLAGTTETGRVFIIPYDQLNYVGFNVELKEAQVRTLFGAPGDEVEEKEPIEEVPPPAAEPAPEPAAEATPPPAATPTAPGKSGIRPGGSLKKALLDRIRARNKGPSGGGPPAGPEPARAAAAMLIGMATLDPETRTELTHTEPAGIQPGGGFCLELERAWGRLRRGYLRRFRPRYVERMRGRRQGRCDSCTHDVIDSRDLKLYRNVCGYSFRDEDIAHRWRDRVPLARAGWAELIVFSAVFLVLAVASALAGALVHPLFYVLLALVLPLWLFVVSFFRDPHRVVPTEADAVVSPADGTVTHVGEVDDPDFPGGRAFRISIFLSVFNVHVNRVPRSGRVADVRYYRGCFLDARKHECAVRNEQLWIDIEEPNGRKVRVKQIAGAIARRIVCWVRPGEEVRAGERYGMIKFGSRTDLLLPAGDAAEVLVQVGSKVRGASTVLLRVRPS